MKQGPGFRKARTAVAAALLLAAAPALSQEELSLPETEPAVLNCLFAGLSQADIGGMKREFEERLFSGKRTDDPFESQRDEKTTALAERCKQTHGLKSREVKEVATYTMFKIGADYLRSGPVPQASVERIEAVVKALPPVEIAAIRAGKKSKGGDEGVIIKLMQAVFTSEAPLDEAAIKRSMTYAASLITVRDLRRKWIERQAGLGK